MYVNAMFNSLFTDYCTIDITDDLKFGTYIRPFVQISLTRTNGRPVVSHHVLAKCWAIQPDHAKAKVQ